MWRVARGRRGVTLAFAAIVALSACGPPPAGSSGATPSAAAARGGTLVFAIWQEPTTLAPIYANQTVATVVSETAVEGLLNTDTDGNYYPVLARSVPTLVNGGVKISADGKKMDVTYELLAGVKWSDGEAFTSADVKFTWETYLKDPKVVTREGYDQIEAVDTPSDTQVVLHYKTIYGPYATRFAGIIPKHVLQNVPDISKSDYNQKPIGTGPFKVTEFVSADHITVERNPTYRKSDRPYLDKIIFRSVPSREVAVAQLKAGEVHGMWNLLEAQIPDLEKDASIRIVATPGPSVERIEFNLAKPADPIADPKVAHPVLGDLNVRRALLLATPKQQIVDKLLFGKAKPGTSPVSQGWASPKGLAQETYDPAKAKQLLEQAGWASGADGIRSKGGVRAALTIVTTTGDKVREQVQQILVDEWRAIGVELQIKNQPSAVLLSGSYSAGDPRKKGSIDMWMYASSPGVDPHQTVNQRYTTGNIPTAANGGAGQNYTRFSNAEVDRLIADAGATVEQPRRAKDYADALKILNDNVAIIWMYDRQLLDAFRSSVSGFKTNTWDNITWNAEDWSIAK
jgi:peptide/nickel transport system substrate-binding protein